MTFPIPPNTTQNNRWTCRVCFQRDFRDEEVTRLGCKHLACFKCYYEWMHNGCDRCCDCIDNGRVDRNTQAITRAVRKHLKPDYDIGNGK